MPAGFTPVEAKLVGGLPHRLRLTADITLVVVVPSGLAVTWRDCDPTILVSSSKAERIPTTPRSGNAIGTVEHPPARLIVRRATTTVASIPLTLGLRRTIPEMGREDASRRLELIVLGWDIYAGSLRGPGDFGSRISLAWRRADQAVNDFAVPPITPYLIPRLEPGDRLESTLGSTQALL